MSENEEKEAVVPEATSNNQPPHEASWPEADDLLRTFSYLANVLKMEFPLTLSIKGQLISGYCIGYDEYMELMKEGLEGFCESFGESGIEILGTLDKVFGISGTLEGTHQSEFREINFIHLRDARIFTSSNSQPIPTSERGVAWRSPLSAVDGFSFGALQLGQQETTD